MGARRDSGDAETVFLREAGNYYVLESCVHQAKGIHGVQGLAGVQGQGSQGQSEGEGHGGRVEDGP